MKNEFVCNVKRAQKESLLFRTISRLFMEMTMDNKAFYGFCVNKVILSPDKSRCTVLFCAVGGKEEFDAKFQDLKLYKPSLRAALAKDINGRYTPDIVFKYDVTQEKVRRIDDLLNKIHEQEFQEDSSEE